MDQLVLDAQNELSTEFPMNQDVNSGDMIGISTRLPMLIIFVLTL